MRGKEWKLYSAQRYSSDEKRGVDRLVNLAAECKGLLWQWDDSRWGKGSLEGLSVCSPSKGDDVLRVLSVVFIHVITCQM